MKYMHNILQGITPKQKSWKSKVKLISTLISEPDTHHIVPDNLVEWVRDVGLRPELNCEDKISWWTVKAKTR